MNFSAVILAGGRSSRMGRDKAYLEIDGQPLLARQIELARNTGAGEILVSAGADNDYSNFGCRVLRDTFRDAGPLAGIERALAVTSSPLLLVLAVDLGEMTAGFLQSLAAHCNENTGAIPRAETSMEPLAAFYPECAAPQIRSLLEQGFNSVKTFAERCVKSRLARFIEVAPDEKRLFANWNSPMDVSLTSRKDVQMQASTSTW